MMPENDKNTNVARESGAMAVAVAAGFLVWALSPRLTGQPLPWDAKWPFYSLVLLAAGLVASQLGQRMGFSFAATWAGQVIALVTLPLDRTANMMGQGAWWVLGIAATGVGSLILVLGWLLGTFVRKKLREPGTRT